MQHQRKHGMPLSFVSQAEGVSMAKCKDCGYLSVRRYQSRELVEVEFGLRETGNQPDIPHSQKPYEDSPICFVRACEIQDEQIKTPDDFLNIISKDRDCDSITEWHQGYKPREHLDMNLLEQQRERLEREAEVNLKRREQQTRLDQKWREDQAAREHNWRQEDVALAKTAMKVHVRSYLIAAIIGFAGAMAAVLLTFLLAKSFQ